MKRQPEPPFEATLGSALGVALGSAVVRIDPVGGGCLNAAYRAQLRDGTAVFVKTGQDDYEAEAAGLRWIADAPDGPATPQVLAAEPGFLALEWIEPGPSDRRADAELGRRLAMLHRAGAPAHGATPPKAPAGSLTIGPLKLTLTSGPWAEVYESLLLQLSPGPMIERLVERLPELAGPAEPPARLHGDLWSGNVLTDAAGAPHVIDPACYGGHREIDLAMLSLFGGPGTAFTRAYEEVYPLAPGHEDRVGLYQLLPLLVHARLFGGGYTGQARAVARRYAGE